MHNEIHNVKKPGEALPSQVFQEVVKCNQTTKDRLEAKLARALPIKNTVVRHRYYTLCGCETPTYMDDIRKTCESIIESLVCKECSERVPI